MDDQSKDTNEDRLSSVPLPPAPEDNREPEVSPSIYDHIWTAPGRVISWLQESRPEEPLTEDQVRPVGHISLSRPHTRRSSLISSNIDVNQPNINATRTILRERDTDIELVHALPTTMRAERVLCKEHLGMLHATLPPRWRMCSKWQLVYSTRRDGFSLNTLYSKCRPVNETPVVLAVRDQGGAVFGAWLTEPLRPRIGHYGTGECFLWRLTSDRHHHHKLGMEKFATSGKNEYFVVSEPSYLAVGVSNGVFGLWIDEQILNGSSRPCTTYDNPCLASDVEFQCDQAEVWSLVREAF